VERNNPMQKTTAIINNQQGSVITMALILLALLTLIAIAANHTSTTERKLATNVLGHNTAFYTADAGIEAGRAALSNLKLADRGSWDILLSNPSAAPENKIALNCGVGDCYNLNDVIDAGGGRTVGPTTFSLTIKDNDDRDNDDTVDTDETVLLTSTASYRGSVITIEAMVRAGGGGAAYAQEHYDAASTGEASAESVIVDSNVRWQAQ